MDIVEERKLAAELRDLRDQQVVVEAFKRLAVNADFNTLIHKHYLNSYAVSLVLQKANASSTAEQRESLENKLNAIASFSRFLEDMDTLSNSIDQRISDTTQVLNQI